MTAHSLKTELKDRTLWYDGGSVVPSSDIQELILKNGSVAKLFVDSLTEDIANYNKLVSQEERITTKDGCDALDYGWNIPAEYVDLNIRNYVFDLMQEEALKRSLSDEDTKKRIIRINQELKLIDRANLNMLVRTLIYVINTLSQRNVVWGVGRGSSVSSYVLYLIGVHDVDSVEYDLDIEDFLRV